MNGNPAPNATAGNAILIATGFNALLTNGTAAGLFITEAEL
jgi:hypothetical protein